MVHGRLSTKRTVPLVTYGAGRVNTQVASPQKTQEAADGYRRKAPSLPTSEPQSTALAIFDGTIGCFLIILCLSYAANAADRQIFPTLLPQIAKVFGYNLKIGGLLATISRWAWPSRAFPTGYILDRTSRKAIIIIGMLLYSVFTLATIYASGIWDMLIYRAFTGVGRACKWRACLPPWAATSTAGGQCSSVA